MLKTHEKFHSANGKRLILIADDELINRELLKIALKDTYEIITAGNGNEALQMVREHHDVLSLILLDLIMPEIHGLDLLRILKNDQELKDIPVIIMTADQESEVRCLRLGAADFIPKPYPSQEVITARVERAIELFEDRDIIHSTERDSLTGLYNREYFYRYAEQYDHHHLDTEMDAIVIDVHHFRMINERFGKAYGDDVLRRIGEKVREIVRESGGIVSRRDADTFLVYCPHRDDYEEILKNASVDLTGEDTADNRVRLRMGVYENVDKKIEIERRFDRAKMASDTLRGNFIRNIAIYDNKLHEDELHAEKLLEDFPKAIEEKQFVVYYQPKFDVRPEIPILSSAEALIRWEHPTMGMISPGAFIPLFEENGLIQRLDLYVWREAAAQIKSWKERFDISVPVSVNVSRVDMYDPNLIDTFCKLLEEFDLEPGELLLEITESAYTQDSSQIISTVNSLREIGFKIEMDDFGTGYSSLNMISNLPIDALKLDMKFIRNAFRDGSDTRLIEVIIDIAKYLGVPTIAEGVETLEQLNKLRALGCDIVQGFYFSKPVPAEKYEVFVKERKQQSDDSTSFAGAKAEQAPERIVSTSIAHALTTGFETIYYVNTANGHYIEFSAQGDHDDLQIDRSGSDFFGETQHNIPRVVYPGDQERVALSMQKDALLDQLIGGRTFSMTYRLMINDDAVYYNLRAVNAPEKGDHHIVIGISNVEEQIKQTNDLLENSELNRQFFSIAQALSSDFESIYYVDTITGDYTEFTAQGSYERLQIPISGKGFFEECQKNLPKVVYEEDLENVSSTMRKDELLKTLEKHRIHSLLYRLVIDGKPVYYNMKIVLAEDDRHLIIVVANAEEQVAREQVLETSQQNTLTYSRIAQALSKDYFSIYLVDTETDEFIEYSSNNDYQELQVEQNGVNFFEDCKRNIIKFVHPEDLEMALAVWDKQKLMSELKNGRTFSSTYRIMMEGTPVFINCKVIRLENRDDEKHIVIGVSNVDAQVRRERELNAAREKANRDALTGVKSKHAYNEAAVESNTKIKKSEEKPFAIVVCDVNGLKTVNDTKGHAAGDKLIKDAAHIICEIFKHSPVYRIGGDEFVAVLRGSDYDQRQALIDSMEEGNRMRKKTGDVMIACGIAEWDGANDTRFEDVFDRADKEMYINKEMFKQ